MSTATEQDKDEHAKANAASWLESIREMVGKLTRKGAAEIFAEEQNREQVIAFLDEFDCPVEPERWDGESDTELREFLVDAIRDGGFEPDDFKFDEESARETIQESVLSVEVRSDWYSPGADSDDDSRKPSEFCILLSTGGPALRLIGELDENGQPTRAWLEYQDWGTPWTHYYVEGAGEVLLEFAGVFYFGE